MKTLFRLSAVLVLSAAIARGEGWVSGAPDRGAGRYLYVHAEFVGDDAGERRFAEPRRAVEQNVVERFSSEFSRLDIYLKVLDDAALPDEIVEPLRPQRRFLGSLARSQPRLCDSFFHIYPLNQ